MTIFVTGGAGIRGANFVLDWLVATTDPVFALTVDINLPLGLPPKLPVKAQRYAAFVHSEVLAIC